MIFSFSNKQGVNKKLLNHLTKKIYKKNPNPNTAPPPTTRAQYPHDSSRRTHLLVDLATALAPSRQNAPGHAAARRRHAAARPARLW